MKKFLNHIKSTREPHQRRTHALAVAGGITAVIALIWLTTLPLRLQGPTQPVADNGSDNGGAQTLLTAAAENAPTNNSGAAQLQVSTTSVFQ
jgi:hypothetical protein